MGLLSGSGPDLQIVPLDPQTQKLVSDRNSRALQDEGQVASQMNQGVREAGAQAFQTPEQTQSRAAQTGENPASLEAIRNQYMKSAGDAVGGVIRQNQANAAVQRQNRLQAAARTAMAQQQVKTQNYEMLTQAMNNADAARAQVLSSVLGVAGMAAGMYAASPGKKPVQEPQNNYDGGSRGTMEQME